MHNSWALVRVAKVFLDEPDHEHDAYELAGKAGVTTEVLDKLLIRLCANHWLATDDGWKWRLTPVGRRRMVKAIRQARAFTSPEGGTPPVGPLS